MKVRALELFLGKLRAGLLIQFEVTDTERLTRFVADPAFIERMAQPDAPVLSLAYTVADPATVAMFYRDQLAPRFNGKLSDRNGWLLPPFWQNLLPEGVFRDRVAEMRPCDPKDHMEMLAACGRGLAGNVYARPIELDKAQLSRLVTQDNDALEASVFAEPMADGESLSGVQPKLALMRDGDRFVARTQDKNRDTNIIGKLPVVGQPLLPELEELSMRLARAAGVDVCNFYLAPLSQLAVEHSYDLGTVDAQTLFLAVERFDRIKVHGRPRRVHWEDFAQVLSVMPEDKYSRSYATVARLMMRVPSLGEPAVHELLRRLAVNELLGNVDMHLKNMGLIYHDGSTPSFAPAFDIVGYSAYNKREGHALMLLDRALEAPKPRAIAGQAPPPKPSLTPVLLRQFCAQVGIAEKTASTVLRRCAAAAFKSWPALIDSSSLTSRQKERLLAHFNGHRWISQLAARA
ncbi:MAG TPA: type II toxin-antitoxin system HipA family toxin [Burkholderiaceae bacterium]|jgi:serine/threonine-protein kinase HipA